MTLTLLEIHTKWVCQFLCDFTVKDGFICFKSIFISLTNADDNNTTDNNI